MLRFIKHNLTSIYNVEYFPLISLVLFSTFFLLVVYKVIRMSKSTIKELSEMPLKDSIND
jgi:cytochrome c oxidase cbb3-type subunit 4